MKRTIISSFTFLAAMIVVTGLLYPLLVTSAASLIADEEREGSLVTYHGRVVGSSLVGQAWTSPRYFHGRPSAVSYQPLPSGGSNRSIAGRAYRDEISALRDSIAKAHQIGTSRVPADLVMASGSGIDPHISPESASLQVDRILMARGWPLSMKNRVHTLIRQHTESSTMNILGRPRVNVLLLNISLDDLGDL